jgi:Ca2+-binding RTX toxin-like protein
MAQLSVYDVSGLDMVNFVGPAGVGAVVARTPDQIGVQNGPLRLDYYGGFTYGGGGVPLSGTITLIGATYNGRPWFAFNGISLSWNDIVRSTTSFDPAYLDRIMFGGSDTMTGAGYSDRLVAYTGNDTMYGNGGNDTLLGQEGDDVLDGGANADRLTGDAGNDTYVIDDYADVVEETSSFGGNDLVISAISYTLGAHVERLTLAGSAYRGDGNALANTLTGNGWNNAMDGGAGDDSIDGQNGADVLLGRLGNDTILGGGGGDAMDGNEGNDLLVTGDDGDVAFGRAGHDTIRGESGNDILMGEEGSELGATGDDLILGGHGTDQLNGGAGNDTLHGELGIDMITGGSGNDLMSGGLGVDAINTGSGADTIVLNGLADFYGGDAAPDQVDRFDVGVGGDVYDLSRVYAELGVPGAPLAVLRSAGWLRLLQSGADTLLQVDGNGGGDGFATAARLANVTAASVLDSQLIV